MSWDVQASLEAVDRQNAEGCVKTWEDLHRYSLVLRAVDPDLIIETGTFSGKSALWFAKHSSARVITIDTELAPRDEEVRQAWGKLMGQIHFIHGSSTAESTLKVVNDMRRDARRVMVILDSDHAREHVIQELLTYGPMVTSGSYMVVEDTLLHYMPQEERDVYEGDPLQAVQRWQMYFFDEWEHDDYLQHVHEVSQFPKGWWKKL